MKNFDEIQGRGKRLEALIKLSNEIRENEKWKPVSFNDFLYSASEWPETIFRNIFQYFHDMVEYFTIKEDTENQNTFGSLVGLVSYSFENLLRQGCENPFFSDHLFANRFMNLVKGFKKGIQTNRIYLFEGPPGSGKSTFLNNLLKKLESYSKLNEGTLYKTLWRIDIEKIPHLHSVYENLDEYKKLIVADRSYYDSLSAEAQYGYFEIACPNNDHPILQIPRSFRKNFLDELIDNKEFKYKLFNSKEYEWVLKDTPCTICRSIYNGLMDLFNNPLEVFNMVNAKKVIFNRQFGQGIIVYNPGDVRSIKPKRNMSLQNKLKLILNTEEVDFIYSNLANTNNGVLALMDIKENNVDRLKGLHGIISDGVHRIEMVEEYIKSLFVGIINPEDKEHYENIKSFKDRVITVKIPYVLDYKTETAIYLSKFGRDIKNKFLPRVLENFCKIIVSSRLNADTPTIKKIVSDKSKHKFLDDDLLLLKMELYMGDIPSWLSEKDVKNLTDELKKEIIHDSEAEGSKGFSGRQSLSIFNQFLSKFPDNEPLITMADVQLFFKDMNGKMNILVPEKFIDSLVSFYDFYLLQEIKEAIYYFNEKQIFRDIKNYLFAINFEVNEKVKCTYTNDVIEVNEEFFKNFEAMFLGTTSNDDQRKTFRKDILNEYVTKTLSQEIRLKNKDIEDTTQFKSLYKKYIRNIKEYALMPYADNENFRRAIIAYDTKEFNTYDNRLKRDVKRLLNNLVRKFGYTIKGAQISCIYMLDKKLATAF